MIEYDTAYPNAQDTADVTITVVRDATGPIFQPSATYQVTIPETLEIGSVAIDTNAIDQDGVSNNLGKMSTNSRCRFCEIGFIWGGAYRNRCLCP